MDYLEFAVGVAIILMAVYLRYFAGLQTGWEIVMFHPWLDPPATKNPSTPWGLLPQPPEAGVPSQIGIDQTVHAFPLILGLAIHFFRERSAAMAHCSRRRME
jgi:hypothetical protein